jgi:hypothetical protein
MDRFDVFGAEGRKPTMIKGVHTMFYTSQPDELRNFIRDKLGLSYTDVGEGWLLKPLVPAARMRLTGIGS